MSKVIGCPNCGSKELYSKVILSSIVPINANWGHEIDTNNKPHKFIKINVALCRFKIRSLNIKDLLRKATDSNTAIACSNCKQEFSTVDFSNLTRDKKRAQAQKKAEAKPTIVTIK